MGTTAAFWLPCRQRNHANDAEFPSAAMIERGAAAVAHHATATATAATIAAAANAHDRAACRFPRLTNAIKMAVPASPLTAGGHWKVFQVPETASPEGYARSVATVTGSTPAGGHRVVARVTARAA